MRPGPAAASNPYVYVGRALWLGRRVQMTMTRATKRGPRSPRLGFGTGVGGRPLCVLATSAPDEWVRVLVSFRVHFYVLLFGFLFACSCSLDCAPGESALCTHTRTVHHHKCAMSRCQHCDCIVRGRKKNPPPTQNTPIHPHTHLGVPTRAAAAMKRVHSEACGFLIRMPSANCAFSLEAPPR